MAVLCFTRHWGFAKREGRKLSGDTLKRQSNRHKYQFLDENREQHRRTSNRVARFPAVVDKVLHKFAKIKYAPSTLFVCPHCGCSVVRPSANLWRGQECDERTSRLPVSLLLKQYYALKTKWRNCNRNRMNVTRSDWNVPESRRFFAQLREWKELHFWRMSVYLIRINIEFEEMKIEKNESQRKKR